MKAFTKKEIERQDFVDNMIFELIQKILPGGKRVKWDMEMIGEVRDTIQNQLVQRKRIIKMRFYPYRKI